MKVLVVSHNNKSRKTTFNDSKEFEKLDNFVKLDILNNMLAYLQKELGKTIVKTIKE